MSSILKALKKLEEEKKSSTERMDQVSRYDAPATPAARRPRNTLLLLVCGILIGLFAAGGWMLWSGSATEGDSSAQIAGAPSPDRTKDQQPLSSQQGPGSASPELAQPAIPGEQAAIQTEVTTTEAETTGKAVQAPEPIIEPSRESPATAVTSDSLPSNTGEGGRAQTESPAPSPERPSVTATVVRQAPETSAQVVSQSPEVKTDISKASRGVLPPRISNDPVKQPAAVLQSAPTRSEAPNAGAARAPFQVSEIYHQPDEGSLAVVDDLPVMEGTVVNGVLVDKIFPDRVRFIVDGKPVEVFVDKAKP